MSIEESNSMSLGHLVQGQGELLGITEARTPTIRDQFAMAALTGLISIGAHPHSGGYPESKDTATIIEKASKEFLNI